MSLPNDPIMLLSVINTKLRDYYPNLDTLCDEMDISKEEIITRLAAVDYEYDANCNQFV